MKILKLKHTLQLSIAEIDNSGFEDDNFNIIKVNNAKGRGYVINQENKIDQNEPTTVLICTRLEQNDNLPDKIEEIRKHLNFELDTMKEKLLELNK